MLQNLFKQNVVLDTNSIYYKRKLSKAQKQEEEFRNHRNNVESLKSNSLLETHLTQVQEYKLF